MGLYTRDYSSLTKDIENSLEVINSSNNIDDLTSANHGLLSFETEIMSLNDIQLSNYKEKVSKYLKSKTYKEVRHNYETYHNNGNKNYQRNIECNIPIYKKQYDVLNENNDLLKIVSSYTYIDDYTKYNTLRIYFEENNRSFLPLLDDYITKNKIFDCFNPYIAACSVMSTSFKDSYIKITEKNNIKDMINIIHELSHIKYHDLLLKTSKDLNSYTYENLYIEVYPIIEETKFIKCLINNHMFLDDVKLYLQETLVIHKQILESLLKKNKNNSLLLSDIKVINGNIGSELFNMYGIKVNNEKMLSLTTNELVFKTSFSKEDIVDTCKHKLELIKTL